MPYNSAADSFRTKQLCSRLSWRYRAKTGKKTVTLRFQTPFGDLEEGYDVHLRLIGKHVVDFLLVIIELFFASCYACGATSEYRLESADLEGGGSLWSKISDRRGHPPTTICAQTDRPMNALQLCS